MRLGWDDSAYEAGCAATLACLLAGEGVAGITVHGRTTEQRFKGSCRREGIKRVVDAVGDATGHPSSGGVPVLGNGDVRSARDAIDMMNETGCAGVMIGRGSFARPWIFREAWTLQTTGDLPAPMTEEEKVAWLTRLFDRLRTYRGDRPAMHVMRSKLARLGNSLGQSPREGHSKPLKEAVRVALTPAEILEALARWPEREAQARAEQAAWVGRERA